MELTEQLQIDRLLRLAGGVSMSKSEVNSVLVENIDTSSLLGQHQAAYFVCTMRQDKLSGEYRPLKQIIKICKEAGQDINQGIKEEESEVNLPFFAGGL